MAYLIPSSKEAKTCGICYENFLEKNDKWTHEKGELHHPIHRKCWDTWLERDKTCPLCRTTIEPGFYSKTQRVLLTAKKYLMYVMVMTTGTAIGLGSTGALARFVGPSEFLFAVSTTAICTVTCGGIAGGALERVDKVASNCLQRYS